MAGGRVLLDRPQGLPGRDHLRREGRHPILKLLARRSAVGQGKHRLLHFFQPVLEAPGELCRAVGGLLPGLAEGVEPPDQFRQALVQARPWLCSPGAFGRLFAAQGLVHEGPDLGAGSARSSIRIMTRSEPGESPDVDLLVITQPPVNRFELIQLGKSRSAHRRLGEGAGVAVHPPERFRILPERLELDPVGDGRRWSEKPGRPKVAAWIWRTWWSTASRRPVKRLKKVDGGPSGGPSPGAGIPGSGSCRRGCPGSAGLVAEGRQRLPGGQRGLDGPVRLPPASGDSSIPRRAAASSGRWTAPSAVEERLDLLKTTMHRIDLPGPVVLFEVALGQIMASPEPEIRACSI